MVTAIEPGALLEVLANVDLGTKRWRRKAQIIGILGRWGDGHRVGMREIHRRTGISNDLLEELLAELVAAGVLVVVEMGTGTRATTWAVSSTIERWRGVPWLRSVDAVERWAFHVEHERYAETAQRPVYRPRSERKTKQRSEHTSNAERKEHQRSEGASNTGRYEKRAFRRGGVGGALAEIEPEKGLSTVGRTTSASSSLTGGVEAVIAGGEGDWRALRALVQKAGGGAYLKGQPERDLATLVLEHGTEQLRAWVLEAPVRLGVPSLIAWLGDRPYVPSETEMAALAARKEPVEVEPVKDPARPTLRPVAEIMATGAGPAASREVANDAAKAARAALQRRGDDTMNPTEVTQ